MEKLLKIAVLTLVLIVFAAACDGNEMVFTEEEAAPLAENAPGGTGFDFTDEGDEESEPEAAEGPTIELEEEVLPPAVIDAMVPPSGRYIMDHANGTSVCEGITIDIPPSEQEMVTLVAGDRGDSLTITADAEPGNPLVLIRTQGTEIYSEYVGDWTIQGNPFKYVMDYFGDPSVFTGVLSGTTNGEYPCKVERIVGLYITE